MNAKRDMDDKDLENVSGGRGHGEHKRDEPECPKCHEKKAADECHDRECPKK